MFWVGVGSGMGSIVTVVATASEGTAVLVAITAGAEAARSIFAGSAGNIAPYARAGITIHGQMNTNSHTARKSVASCLFFPQFQNIYHAAFRGYTLIRAAMPADQMDTVAIDLPRACPSLIQEIGKGIVACWQSGSGLSRLDFSHANPRPCCHPGTHRLVAALSIPGK